ncbi:MAG: DUF4258 domain-containing protein [Candidatus Rokubacteria bacterium]|nr:DUF4258 domain-containing protein [Candidatus Rokubacteria bacterium]MBI3825132.1 DUF4258 domain-containing protein [Candidatus Rokubacteria bacterium]
MAVADLDAIRRAFCQQTYLFRNTGFAKMLKRGLVAADLVEAICRDTPEIIDDYAADDRGPACLVLGWADLARPLHVVVGYGDSPDVPIEVVTVYEPDARQWYNHRVRRK